MRTVFSGWLLTAASVAGLYVVNGSAETPLPELTAVAYNQAEPISATLARLYAQQRGIPEDHLVGLDCSSDEEIGRDDFEATIAQPLRQAFKERHWWTIRPGDEGNEKVTDTSIRFLAVIRGVPLKIRASAQSNPGELGGTGPIDSHNEASVDSELSLLPLDHHRIAGIIPNAYFQSFRSIRDFENPAPLLVCRLDGPTPEVVRRMIVDSIAAERSGLWGRAYVDSSHRTAPGSEVGDKWLSGIVNQLHKIGIPVAIDDSPSVFPEGFPMNDCALYYGWYAGGITGPFTQAGFKFVPGAVAVHIHSFSASTLRDPNGGWVAPLVARGAAASIGNVYEPYLQLTTHLDMFNDRLLHGFTLAESAYMSVQGLSWMTVVVGDPLYRPYASWLQIDAARDTSRSATPWKAYHEFAVKNGSRPAPEYRVLARQFASRTRNGPMLEDLGLTEVAVGNLGAATAYFQQARACYNKRDDILRVVIEQSDVFLKDNKPRRALDLVRSVLRIVPDAPASALLRKLEQQALESGGTSSKP